MNKRKAVHGLTVAAAVLLSFAVAASAWAQGMFYREVKKDGRIHVFAVAARFELFDKTGETGQSITRTGYGPNGETVVFDGEDAINLYNFKHDLPGEVFAKPKIAPKPADGPSIKLGATVFADYTYQDAPRITDSDKNSANLSSFEVRRAYINVTGSVSDLVAFRITPDVAARQTSSASGLPAGATVAGSLDGSLVVRLKYAFAQFNLDKAVTHGSWIRFGQQQTPYLDFIEGIYRYRFQGTTFTEREGYQSSADVGLSGRLNLPNEYGEIHVGYYNGDTYSKSEANDQKAFEVRGTVRPLPQHDILKGLRLTAFYDDDHPVKNANRKRFVGATTFEHKYVVVGFEYIDARDNASPTKPVVNSSGWDLWLEPRTAFGLEGLFRYDHLKPNESVDAKKSRVIAGISYWFTVKAPLAAALLVDYEQVRCDALLAKPKEGRFEIKTLLNF